MRYVLVPVLAFLLFGNTISAQYLSTSGGDMNGNIIFKASNYQIQCPYYGINYGSAQPSTSGNVGIFANSNSTTLDFVGWSNGWRFIPTNPTTYPAPVVTFSANGNASFNGTTTIGSEYGLPVGSSALTIRGPNGPANNTNFQDITYSFNTAGSAKIRAYRGGSWGTYMDFLVNNEYKGSDAPEVAMHIDATGNIGVGTVSPAAKLQISDGGAEEYGKYGSVQIVKPATPAENSFHLSFVRQGQMYGGFGYANNSSSLCLWMGGNTSSTPLMSFSNDNNQGVGIGTLDTKGYKLAIAGNMVAEKVVVKLKANWPDYVFDSTYRQRSLAEVEQFVKENGHLPEVPTTAEVEKNGVNVGDTQALLLKKIEELTLYIIEQKKEIESLKQRLDKQDKLTEK